jgi:hypothetical protein
MNPDSNRPATAEAAADCARALAVFREGRRHTGVTWSGMAPEPFPIRTAEALARDAEARWAALQRWRRTRSGRLLAAMADAERAVETVRSCIARGLAVSDARCGVALGALERSLAAARSAMDAQSPGGLSEEPCATNIASSNPSTASPRYSAP